LTTPTTDRRDRIARLLEPASIAVVGASPRNHMSQSVLKNLRDFGYNGKVYAVNPNYTQVEGYPCVPHIADVPVVLDLVVLLVPADAVPQVAAEAAEARAGAIVIMSAGFGEDERGGGRDRERLLREALDGHDVVVSGPNSEGYFNVIRGIPLTFSGSIARSSIESSAVVLPEVESLEAVKGGVAVIAQSGGLGFSIFGRGIERGIGFSHVVSVGNELDLDVLECADYLLDQPEVTVIGLYVEGFRSPERLRFVAERARRLGKSVVIGKAGSSITGRSPAISHTGHLAGESRVNSAAFRALGIVEVHDQEEFLDACASLSTLPPMRSDRVAVISWSGGLAVWTADACERAGFSLPSLSEALQRDLTEVLPDFASIRNPIDVTGAGKENPAQILSRIANAENFDAFVLVAPLNHPGMFAAEATEISRVVRATGKPVIVYSYTRPHPQNVARFASVGLPVFESSTRAVFALSALRTVGARPETTYNLAAPAPAGHRRTLSERSTTALLSDRGFPIARQSLASTADQAAKAAAEIHGPVAMKVQAPSMPHKKDSGGVALNVDGDADVRRVFAELMKRTASFADIEGILVQEMVPPGLEMIVGVTNTDGFGPMIMLGFGGSGVEMLSDTTLRAAPLTRQDVLEMLAELRHGAVLTEPLGGLPALAVDQVIDFVIRVSDYAVENSSSLLELDINPLVVTHDRVTMVDALLVTVDK
jgi:acetate---CoA ligase (ADP-forming)